MTYSKFKQIVVKNSNYECENPYCDEQGTLTIHHFFPRSRYPELKTDPDNGMHVCGPCHSYIEELIRKRDGTELQFYPIERYEHIREKVNGN